MNRVWARTFSFTAAGALPLALGLMLPACSNQGEGGRCDPLMGNEDCASGLICYEDLKLCCPPPGTPAKVDACLGGGLTDGGLGDGSISDVGVDAESGAGGSAGQGGQGGTAGAGGDGGQGGQGGSAGESGQGGGGGVGGAAGADAGDGAPEADLDAGDESDGA